MDIYQIEYRELNRDRNNYVVHLSSSEDKAVKWIKKNGIDEWEDTIYYYTVFRCQLDSVDDRGELYLLYFDKHGNRLENIYDL